MVEEKIDNQDLKLASLKVRLRAFIIDDLSITLIVFLLLWDKVSLSDGNLETIILLINEAFFEIIMLKFIYQTFFIWYYGATIGKILSKIKVIDFETYGRVSLLNSAIRSFGRIISESFFYIGFIFANFNEARQTFHDKFGKSLVIYA